MCSARSPTRFLVPDNHLGRATVSSIAVAHEVAAMGGRAIACLNSRDRNVLGFRRDLLTAAAYGVDEFLLVYGDRPDVGRRSDDVSVRRMMEEIRTFGSTRRLRRLPAVRDRRDDAARPTLPSFKHDADFVVTQVSHSIDDLARWRDAIDVRRTCLRRGDGDRQRRDGAQARDAESPQLAVPPWLIDAVDADRDAGVDAACDARRRGGRARRLRRRPRHRRRPLPGGRGAPRGTLGWGRTSGRARSERPIASGAVLRIVLPKGSLERATLELFEAADLTVVRSSAVDYKASIDDPRVAEVRILRPQEIPVYVAEGLFDIGITGRDWVEETSERGRQPR